MSGAEKKIHVVCSQEAAGKTHFDGETIAVALNPFIQWDLEKKKVNSMLLFGVGIDFTISPYIRRVEEGLLKESERNPLLHRWAPLGVRGILYVLGHYLQFRGRFEKILDEHRAREVTLSSSWDLTLVYVLRELCAKRGISLVLEQGPFDLYSSFDAFAVSNDLKPLRWLDPIWLVRLLGFLRGFAQRSIYFQPYWNLSPAEREKVASVKLSNIGTLNQIWLKILNRFGHEPVRLRFDRFVDPKKDFFLSAENWPGFLEGDLIAINSALHSFYQDTSPPHLDRIYARVQALWDGAKGKRLILMDGFNPFSRMMAYAFKRKGGKVDFLPHGFVLEEISHFRVSRFSADRVLAWSGSSARAFEEYGCPSLPIAHPIAQRELQPLKALPSNLSGWKVLVLLGSPHPLDPDYFERTLIAVHKTLSGLGVSGVHWKNHVSHPLGLEVHQKMIRKCEEALGEMMQIPPQERIADRMKEFDFIVICGSTTGILEAMLEGVPYAVFCPQGRIGALGSAFIAQAESESELRNLLENYPWERVREGARSVSHALKEGEHPFSCPTGESIS